MLNVITQSVVILNGNSVFVINVYAASIIS
jgi:hypothetical protein